MDQFVFYNNRCCNALCKRMENMLWQIFESLFELLFI